MCTPINQGVFIRRIFQQFDEEDNEYGIVPEGQSMLKFIIGFINLINFPLEPIM